MIHEQERPATRTIARSFAAGINQARAIPNKKKDRRVLRRPFTIEEE